MKTAPRARGLRGKDGNHMEYRRFGDTLVIRMDRGEEVLSTLTEICEKEGVGLAEVSALGAVDRAEMAIYDVPTKTFFRKTFEGPMEIGSLVGSVTRKEGKVYLHLHGVVCDSELAAHGGHIASLRVSATCEMIVRCFPGSVGRRMDEAIGLNIFTFD